MLKRQFLMGLALAIAAATPAWAEGYMDVAALAKTLPGTEPNHLPLRVASPTLPTTNRSA